MAKAPLAYVVRDLVNVPPHAHDPSTEYATVQEEMVARMPHTHNLYREDNIAVWDIIHNSIHDSEAFSWVKRCERRRDGRAAYLALTAHYLGDAKNDGSTPGQYYQQPPYHLPPYPPANLPPMGPPPPPPPPPPPAHHVGAVHQQNNHYGNGNIHHPALNRFPGNQQGFAPPGPPRF
jgi:hypothetical protein